MASHGGYDGGGLTAGGKIRRRPASRAAAASPYAPPVAATVPAARGGEGSGWLSRLITGSASRLIPSVFRKPPPPPLPEPFNAQPTRLESLDARPSQPELLDAPHSPPPPPLEDDIPEGEENGGQTAKNLYTDNPENSVKDRDVMLRSSDCHRGIELEELLKQTTSTRSEFEYLSGLLRPRTVGYNTSQAEVGNIKQTESGKKENGSRGLPVNFSVRSYSVADQVASPAELAKAYMGSRLPEGSPLRLRLHDPSFLPNKPVEAITVDKSLNPTLIQSSRLSASTSFDHLGSNYMTPNKSAIHKMSLSPYFKGPVPSRDMSGTVSSSYQTSNSVCTFGRQQILKRKSVALNNETVSLPPLFPPPASPPWLLHLFALSEGLDPPRFVPMLPQPPELATVIRRLAGYRFDAQNIMHCRNGNIFTSLHEEGVLAPEVHHRLCPDRGMPIIPSFPHLQDRSLENFCLILSKEEEGRSSYLHVFGEVTKEVGKTMTRVFMLQDGVWRMLTSATCQLPPLWLDPKDPTRNEE